MLHCFTYFTNPSKATPLLESAAQHGLQIQNLATSSTWNGLQDKLLAMKQVLYELPESDICCFVDAYDVIANTTPRQLLEVYTHSGASILFGAETQLDPPCCPVDLYPSSPTRFRFLNSGVYIGRVSALRAMLEWGNFLERNDQEYAHAYFLAEGKAQGLQLDTGCNLVLNMWAIPWNRIGFQTGSISFLEFNTNPCFVHFNGQSFLDFQRDFRLCSEGFRYTPNPEDHATLQRCVELKRRSLLSDEMEFLEGEGHTYRGAS